jgi:hypothetical protein
MNPNSDNFKYDRIKKRGGWSIILKSFHPMNPNSDNLRMIGLKKEGMEHNPLIFKSYES